MKTNQEEAQSLVVIRDDMSNCWLQFSRPLRIVQAIKHDEVVPALITLNDAVEKEEFTLLVLYRMKQHLVLMNGTLQ